MGPQGCLESLAGSHLSQKGFLAQQIMRLSQRAHVREQEEGGCKEEKEALVAGEPHGNYMDSEWNCYQDTLNMLALEA